MPPMVLFSPLTNTARALLGLVPIADARATGALVLSAYACFYWT